MFGYICPELVVEKIVTGVLADAEKYSAEDTIKYILTLKYFIESSNVKEIIGLAGSTAGLASAFFFTSPVGIAAGTTVAIASGVNLYKTYKASKTYKKLFNCLSLALYCIHELEPNDVRKILDTITTEDLVEFLEDNGCTIRG